MDTLLIWTLGLGLLCLWLAYLLMMAKLRQRSDISLARGDAIKRSRAVLNGQLNEQLAPFLPGFAYRPSEARFIGKPVDFIVFAGLDEGRIDEVVFVEVKTGGSSLSSRERSLRQAIEEKRVRFVEWRAKQ